VSKRRSDDDEPIKAARGATLYTGSSEKREKRDWSKYNLEDRENRLVFNPADDPQFERQLINYLAANGIEVASYKDRYILRRLRVRMGRLKYSSYKEYLDYIRRNPDELKEIQESLSINVTRFFRNRDTYEEVRDQIFPLLSSDRSNIKVWSAGCAVGAEPYSIAMILADAISPTVKANVLATDVKEELLRTARYGIYSEPYLAEMKPLEISKFFLETPSGDYKVKPHIRSMVSFRQQDLMKDDFPRNIDVIFCRNVLIYVDRNAQNVILNKFFEALKPGGYLVLGRTETLFGDWRKSVNIISTKHRIYQKKKLGQFEAISFESVKESRSRRESFGETRNVVPKVMSTKDRLEELKNFRETFEERRKMWEERMEKSRKIRDERVGTLKRSTMATKRNAGAERTITTFRQIKKRMEETSEASGSLSDYRKLLKKSKEATRESKIRRDRK
jgi:chemotaxis protein methyltransferase CheR